MYVRVTVTPKAKKERVERIDETTFSVTVREPAERNLANRRVRELIAEAFSVSLSQARLISGHRSAKKIINIDT